jgi:hypothetical protein
LLLICSSSEMPAHYDKLRRVAQSYGKTRARNWEEIDRNSMRQRVQWLVENYRVICQTLRLPASTASLHRLQRIAEKLMLLPLALLMVCFAGLALHQPGGAERWTGWIILLLGLQMSMLWPLVGYFTMARALERGALLSVLTEELALQRAGPGAPAADTQAAHDTPAQNSDSAGTIKQLPRVRE